MGKIEGDRIVPQTVKRWSGSQRNQWINVKITLSSPATWTLVLESHVGSGSHSDMALDDLQVYKGRCQFNVKIEGDRIVPQTVKRWSGSQRNQWINVKITLPPLPRGLWCWRVMSAQDLTQTWPW